MKNIYITLFFGVIFYSCDSNTKIKNKLTIGENDQRKTEILIESFLKDTLYNSVNFIPQKGIIKVDSVFNDLIDDSLRFKLNHYKTALFNFNSQINTIEKNIKNNKYIFKNKDLEINNDTTLLWYRYGRIKFISEDLMLYYQNMDKRFIGWKVTYQYEINDGADKNPTYTNFFILDPNFSKVLYFRNNDWEEKFNIDIFKIENTNKLFFNEIQIDIYRTLIKN